MMQAEAKAAWLDVSGAFDAFRDARNYVERIEKELDNGVGNPDDLNSARASLQESARRLYLALYENRLTLDEFFGE